MNEALIDLEAVAHNVRLISRAAEPAGLMAVVKANAYGHGQDAVARTALQNGARWLGVATAAEALALRSSGLDVPALMWLHTPGEDLRAVLAAGVDVAVSSLQQLLDLAEQAEAVGVTALLHLKIDTGLRRGGSMIQEWPALVGAAAQQERGGRIRVRGIWSHLADAENVDSHRSAEQLQVFAEAVAQARAAGLNPTLLHLANSAGLLTMLESHFSMVRSGLALYGVEPIEGRTFGLCPAMTLHASVVLTKQIPAGAEVSYGQHWRAPKDTTLALVPLGFADGIPRQAWRQASVLINGARCPIAGPITMDQFLVDIGDLAVQPGDEAVVFGPGFDGEPTAAEWAGWSGTIPSDILCAITARVPRRYLPERQEVDK
jgi:alanine racemase